MKKPAVILFFVIIVVALFSIPTASAGNVTVLISGEQNVKPGQTYTYSYILNMNDCYETQAGFQCSNASLSGDTKVSYTNSFFENTNFSTSGTLYVKIDESADIGDTIDITTSGRYSTVSDEGIPNLWDISYSYTLTVVSDETPTPLPTTTPSEPVPSETAISAPPLPEPEATPPKPTAHPSAKPSNLVSDTNPSQMAIPSQSEELLTNTQISQPPDPNGISSLYSQLDLMSKGGTVIVSLDPFTESNFSALTLRLLKAKQSKLIIDYNSYSCTIDGNKLAATINTPVNLYMDMTINQKISDAADGNDLYQLHFSEVGDFPGCLVYEIPAVKNQPGDVLYLYQYHIISGVNEYKQSVAVDDNGHVSFEIYEGDSYFISALLTDNPETGDNPAQISNGSDFLYIIIPISSVVLAIAVIFAALIIRKTATNRHSPNR